MFVHDLVGSEQHPVYSELATENLGRQYSFLRSITLTSLALGQPLLSIEVIKALNYHAIACLHPNAGEFRPCPVKVGEDFEPPPHFKVSPLMQMFTNQVNRHWETSDAVALAAFVLWRINYIHPFINGNGRTARAACHFVLCLKSGGWLPGEPILPELLRANRDEYVKLLKLADASAIAGALDLNPLHELLIRLLDQQILSAGPPPPDDARVIVLPAPADQAPA